MIPANYILNRQGPFFSHCGLSSRYSGNVHCPKGNRFSEYNIKCSGGNRDTTRNTSCSISFFSTFHVISRKFGLLFGQSKTYQLGNIVLPLYASLRVYNFRSRHYMLGNSLEGLHVKLSVVNIPRVSAWLADSNQQAVHANAAAKGMRIHVIFRPL